MSAQGDNAAAWIYRGVWRALVDWLDVPRDPPELPKGGGDQVSKMHPAAGFLRYLKFWFWIALLPLDLAILAGWIIVAANSWLWAAILAPPALVVAVVPDLIAYVAIHLRYDTTWYVMSDRSLRIRRGVWSIHEMTITFENVQNVKITQGPMQRRFGVANVLVETAGAGGAAGPHGSRGPALNQGVLEGVADAEGMRDRIMARVRASRSAGLGDDRDDGAPPPRGGAWTPEHLGALREIRDLLARSA